MARKFVPVDDPDALEATLDDLDVGDNESSDDSPHDDFNEAAENKPVKRKKSGEMEDDEVQSIIFQQLTDAVSFADTEMSRVRAAATQAYRGEGEDKVEPGRSSIVSSDVRDVVQGQLPDLMRMFFSSENAVEFEPNGAPDAATAERQANTADQATDYANYVFERDNDGFTILHSTFKDALLRKVGIVKYWWDESETVTTERYTGLDEMGYFVLQQDSEIEKLEIEKKYPDESVEAQAGAPDSPKAMLVDACATRRTTKGRVRIMTLPPEEFLIDRRARSLEDFTILAHRSMKTVSELVAMGYDADDVREYVTSDELATNIEYIERQPLSSAVGSFDSLNPETQRVMYVEAFAYIDKDGDGIAELIKICAMGPGYVVMHSEPVSDTGFADFHSDPEPHTFFGMSQYDGVKDVQRIKTNILRNTLDSLAQSIHPRTAVVEGQVNMDDVMNNEVGAIIRMRAPGMVQPFVTPFVGQQAMDMIEYMDEVREMRTGVSRTQLGLDADTMQSTTKLAVQQSISGSQGKIELIARVLANGMRKLFRGILHLLVENQDRPRIIRMRGQWVAMDPRAWVSDVDVKINIALGGGTTDSKIAALTQIIAKQELILQTLGSQNPLVSLSQYGNACRAFTELAGFRNSSRFFNQVPPDWKPPQNTPPAPPPDPQLILGQQNLQLQAKKDANDAALNQQREAREARKDSVDAFLKNKDMELKYGVQIHNAHVDAIVQHSTAITNQNSADHRNWMDNAASLTGQKLAIDNQPPPASGQSLQ